MPRPIQARIDLEAIRHNYSIAKQRVASASRQPKAWAVVKADAYGHGLMRVASALDSVARATAVAVTPATRRASTR